jgi:hypothetical protein
MMTFYDKKTKGLMISKVCPMTLNQILITRKRKNLMTHAVFNSDKDCFVRANIKGVMLVTIYSKGKKPEGL